MPTLIAVSLDKSHNWKNAYAQPDYMLFKSTISLEQNDEKDSLFASWYKLIEIVMISGLYVCLSIWHFSQGQLISFFWFLAQWQIIVIFKNWQSSFFQEISFLLNCGEKKGPKCPQKYGFLNVLKNFLTTFSWK